MRHTRTITLAISLPFFAFASACDAPENEAELEALDIEDDEDQAAHDEESPEAPLESLGLEDADHPSNAGPAGECCFANCGGDGTHQYKNIGNNDDCNHRAGLFCKSQGWSLIDAKWDLC